MPPSSSVAENKIQRLVIHFHSVRDKTSLRTVELRSGSGLVWKKDMNLAGDYTTWETEYPKPGANVWTWPDGMKVHSQSWFRLVITVP